MRLLYLVLVSLAFLQTLIVLVWATIDYLELRDQQGALRRTAAHSMTMHLWMLVAECSALVHTRDALILIDLCIVGALAAMAANSLAWRAFAWREFMDGE